MSKRRPAEFHYYDWDFNLWFGSETRARCKAIPGDYPMGLLANAAEGAYRNLLDYCYKQGDIPGDIGGLSALCGMSPEVFEMVWPAFRNKFVKARRTGRLTLREIRHRRGKSRRMSGAEWLKLRRRIIARDGRVCRYCGVIASRIEVDHVQPISLRGSNDESNLVVSCYQCNRSKGSKPLTRWLS